MCYETLKSFVKTNFRPDPTTMQLLTCGGIAGAVAQTGFTLLVIVILK